MFEHLLPTGEADNTLLPRADTFLQGRRGHRGEMLPWDGRAPPSPKLLSLVQPREGIKVLATPGISASSSTSSSAEADSTPPQTPTHCVAEAEISLESAEGVWVPGVVEEPAAVQAFLHTLPCLVAQQVPSGVEEALLGQPLISAH